MKKFLKDTGSKLSKRLEGSGLQRWFERLESDKRSRLVKATALVAAVALMWWLSGVWNEADQQKRLEKAPEVQTSEVDLSLDPTLMTETWIEKASKQVAKNSKNIADLKASMSRIEEMFGDIKTLLAEQSKKADMIYEGEVKSRNATREEEKKKAAEVKSAYREAAGALPSLPQPTPVPAAAGAPQGKGGGPRGGGKGPQGPGVVSLIHVAVEAPPAPKEGGSKRLEEFAPAGSFVRVRLLTGVNAPTGMKAKGQPQPVLLKVEDPAFLPNRVRMDVKGCFVVGEAYGELASERAYVRTDKFSCVKKDGTVIQRPVHGYLVDTDGVIGMRGRIVSRRGLFLARSLTANFIEGVAQAFRTSLTNISVTPLGGTVSTVDSGDALKIGLGEGVAKSVEDLAKMYRELAQETFPVIEVGAGRQGHLVLVDKLALNAGNGG